METVPDAEQRNEVLKIVLIIAIPVGIAALTTWINITIKFAPDAKEKPK